jgi:hypothetical protein
MAQDRVQLRALLLAVFNGVEVTSNGTTFVPNSD